MAKKIVKVRRIKLIPCLAVVLILGGLFFGVYLLLKLPVKNIVVEGTSYLNDDYVLKLAEVIDYPSFYASSTIEDISKCSPAMFFPRLSYSFVEIVTLLKIASSVLFVIFIPCLVNSRFNFSNFVIRFESSFISFFFCSKVLQCIISYTQSAERSHGYV